MTSPLHPWQVLDSREVFSAPPWVRITRQRVRVQDGRVINDYHQVCLPNYATVAAFTPDGKLIFERMYKHGLGRVALFLPSGGIDDGEQPQVTAQRELREETGYEASRWTSLGHYIVNSNQGCGTAHLFVARDAIRVADPQSGDLESMQIELLSHGEAMKALRSGEIGSMTTALTLMLATQEVSFR